jgi:outer membrane protein assembly factor BamB
MPRLAIWTGVLIVSGLLTPAGVFATDWPQWRGPERNGSVASPVKLASAWGEKGPAPLWMSEPIPAGYGSPTVALGKVYMYVSWTRDVPRTTRVLAPDRARGIGDFVADIPANLIEKIEAARIGPERAALADDKLSAWIEEWGKSNLPEPQPEVRRFAEDRLRRGAKAQPLATLAKIHEQIGREFTFEDFDAWLAASCFSDDERKLVEQAAPKVQTRVKDVVVCLDATDGKTLWKHEAEVGESRGRGTGCTPCVAEGRVYVAGCQGTAYCLDAETGREVWKASLGRGEIDASFAVDGGTAYIMAHGLTALDAATGRQLWVQKKTGHGHASPVFWRGPERTYVLGHSGRLWCIDAKSGEVAWDAPGGGHCTPAVESDRLALLTEAEDDRTGLLIYRLTPEKAELLGQAAVSARGCSPIIDGQRVYAVGSGNAACFDLAQGKLLWEGRVGNENWSSPLLADGKIIAKLGRVLGLIDASTGETLDRARLEIAECTSPALAEGRLFVRSPDGIACLDLTGGQPAAETASREVERQ